MAKVPPRNPKYSAADLWPPGSQGVEFPPAAFHPIYLGNFLCQNYLELVPRVQQYFASKGLLARMVFSRSADSDPFRSYQDKTRLYDCLVYFTRPEDAQDAIKYLHRDKYFGHRLNIFPGRTPEPVLADKSVAYVIPNTMSEWPDVFIEEHIKQQTKAQVQITLRLGETELIVQYVNRIHQELALRHYRFFVPSSLIGHAINHQRFLEYEVLDEIRLQMAHTPFLLMGPERLVLYALYAGRRPDVPMDWTNQKLMVDPVQYPCMPDYRTQLELARRTLRIFGQPCSFIDKIDKLSKDADIKRAVKALRQEVGKTMKARRRQFRESTVTNSALNVPLPWQNVMKK